MEYFYTYYIWLTGISLIVLILEQMLPWRKGQRILRPQFGQDILWIILNGHFFGLLLGYFSAQLLSYLNASLSSLDITTPDSLELLASLPLWLQFPVFILLKDFIEWNTHRMLHKHSFLWQFHKIHHSIITMDWIGNMRFHWVEIVIYKSIAYFPLIILGIDWQVLFWVAIVQTTIGHLNHSNLYISWGPLKYILNSPRMHLWHHDEKMHGPYGQNFGIVFSVWDWIFGTAYWPKDKEGPEKLGFHGLDKLPSGFLRRLVYPIFR